MTSSPQPGPKNSQTERITTVLETDEDLRRALLLSKKEREQTVLLEPKTVEPPQETGRPASVSPFRPTARPPVPRLTVFDDGKTDGEVIRLREPRFVIGRTEGDLRFPLDGRMSSRHVEITHQHVGGLHRWVITDLQSTHGLFVRVSKTALADKAEFLVGAGRYRFEANQPTPEAEVDRVAGDVGSGTTQDWAEGTSALRPPALSEMLGREIGNRILLIHGEYWIGSDPSCPIRRADDPFCEPRHVRLYRGSQGHWHAEHNKTQNGLWLRMAQITVDSMIHFQIGEQRFKLKLT